MAKVANNGRRKGLPDGRFMSVPHAILKTEKYRHLSPWAVRLLLDLFMQYDGHNNGDFSAAWSMMRKRGWRSKGTLNAAIHELLEAGYIEKTRQGGKHQCSLYGVTWKPIDDCKGKLDMRPTKVAAGLWNDG